MPSIAANPNLPPFCFLEKRGAKTRFKSSAPIPQPLGDRQ